MFQGSLRDFSVFIKSDQSAELLLPVVRDRLNEIDANLPIFLSGSLGDFVDDSFNNRRAVMLLLTVFAGIALVLSAIGIYGVIAYSVSSQRREIGTRVAIGADRAQVRWLFVRRGLIKALIGIGVGLASAIGLSRFMASMLYEVSPTEPLVLGCITVLLFVISMVASYIPAMRAARIEPMEALRSE